MRALQDNDPPAMQPASGTDEDRAAEPSMDAVHTPSASARDDIADARCTREAACDNIGGDKKYSSAEDCLVSIRADWKDDLNARECPGGVNQAQLSECLTAIRNEDCGHPFDTLGRFAACTTSQICIDE